MSSFLRFIRKIFVSAFVVVTFAAYVVHERAVNPQDPAAMAMAPIATIATPAQTSALAGQSSSQARNNGLAIIAPTRTPFVLPTITPSPTTAPEVPAADLPAMDSSQTSPPAPQIPTADVPTEIPTQEPPTEVPTEEPATATSTDMPPTEVPTEEPPTATSTDVPPTEVPTAVAEGQYKDGTYTGPEVDAYYGMVQVQAVVQNGQLTDVQFLDYPHDRRTSQRINAQADPYLQTEAIQAQSANVDIISGATLTSRAFIQSLQSALDLAARS